MALSSKQAEISQSHIDRIKERAPELISYLQRNDFAQAAYIINDLESLRDIDLYREIGQLTRCLHDVLRQFNLPESEDQFNDHFELQDIANISEATDRLDYVMKTTEEAANKTMDLVERSMPLSETMASDANSMQAQWHRFLQKELDANEFRDLCSKIDDFLHQQQASSQDLQSLLSEILLAQGYQDLTGQVIKQIVGLVRSIEISLVNLLTMVSRFENIANSNLSLNDHAENANAASKENEVSDKKTHAKQAKREEQIKAEGPIINAENREDVLSSQDEVDALLSSLGF